MRAHYICATARKSKRGRVSNLSGLFLRFLVREPGAASDIQRGISRGDSVLEFSRHCSTPKENVFTISHNPSVDLEYSCGKLATNFYDDPKGLTILEFRFERLFDFVTNNVWKSTRFLYDWIRNVSERINVNLVLLFNSKWRMNILE